MRQMPPQVAKLLGTQISCPKHVCRPPACGVGLNCDDPFRANLRETAISSPFRQFRGCNSQNRLPSGTNILLGTSWEQRRLRQLALWVGAFQS
jgi:hypothetical protein